MMHDQGFEIWHGFLLIMVFKPPTMTIIKSWTKISCYQWSQVENGLSWHKYKVAPSTSSCSESEHLHWCPNDSITLHAFTMLGSLYHYKLVANLSEINVPSVPKWLSLFKEFFGPKWLSCFSVIHETIVLLLQWRLRDTWDSLATSWSKPTYPCSYAGACSCYHLWHSSTQLCILQGKKNVIIFSLGISLKDSMTTFNYSGGQIETSMLASLYL